MAHKGRNRFIWSLVLIMFLVISACNQGGGGGTATEPEPSSQQPQQSQEPQPSDGPIRFSYYVNENTYQLLENSIQWKHMQEAANAEVELINAGDRAQYPQNLNLLIASNETLPDTLWTDVDTANEYGSAGVFIDLKPLIDEHAPNLKAFLEQNSTYEKLITAGDGSIYTIIAGFPAIGDATFAYRKDWADQLGLEVPETLDEFTDMLRAVKAANPEGQNYFYPLLFQNYVFINMAFYMIFDFENVSLRQNVFNPNYKEFIEYLKMLYDEGLIDPESARGAVSEDAHMAKMVNGNSFMFFRTLANAEQYTINGKALNPNYAMSTIPPLAPVHGDLRAYWKGGSYQRGDAVPITRDAEDPVSIIKFFDFLFSDEGRDIKSWGVEGESYTVENGEKKLLLTSEDISGIEFTEPHWSLLVPGAYSLPMVHREEPALQLASPLVKELRAISYGQYKLEDPEVVIMTEEDAQRRTELEAEVLPKRDSWIVSFVTGDKPMSEWDAFLQDMTASGYQELMDILDRSLLK